MATYADVIATVSSLMNDTAQSIYTNVAVLPYLNTALDDLQEIFGQNNLPITNEVSAVITVPTPNRVVAFGAVPPAPALPTDLLEIQRIWETQSGEDNWIPMTKKEFLDLYADDVATNHFLFWAWVNQEIRLPLANQDIDLKLQYIASRFSPVLIGGVNASLPVLNAKSYLSYHTAALCAMFIAENPTRAEVLANLAEDALSRTLGINNKGRQSIATRRRPFRASYKTRGPFV
jgi:hypothetical protein